MTGGPPVRRRPLPAWEARGAPQDEATLAAWLARAAEAARGIRESAGLPAAVDEAARGIWLVLPTAAQAERFAAGLRAERTPARAVDGCTVWLDVTTDGSQEHLDHLVLGVTKVAHYLGLRHATRAGGA